MTCAGISALVVAAGRLSAGDAQVSGTTVRCCCDQQDLEPLERGLQWLGSRFSVHTNPGYTSGATVELSRGGLYYYLYGVERVGRLTGRRFLGRHDWYREGADVRRATGSAGRLLAGVGFREDDPLVATSFALLFLSKGRRPVVMAKLKSGHDNDWDRHRGAVQNLTRDIERRWKQRLSWQTVDAHAASVEDLLESPVLVISGRNGLELTARPEAAPEGLCRARRLHPGRDLLRGPRVRPRFPQADGRAVSQQPVAAAAGRARRLVRRAAGEIQVLAGAVRDRRLLPDQRGVLPAESVVLLGVEPRRAGERLPAERAGGDRRLPGHRGQHHRLRHQPAAEGQAGPPGSRRPRQAGGADARHAADPDARPQRGQQRGHQRAAEPAAVAAARRCGCR